MDTRAADTAMRALASHQHALVDRDGLRAAASTGTHWLAAVLDAGSGAVVSHRSAAALWACSALPSRPFT